jgi:hypothetical protein
MHATARLTDDSKSQLALQYAHSIRDAAPHTFVFWVHASTRARFEEAYKDIAGRLGLPGRDDPEANVLRLVHDWLRDEANGQWVMVVDNVDDVETFFPSRKRQRQGGEADASAQIWEVFIKVRPPCMQLALPARTSDPTQISIQTDAIKGLMHPICAQNL